MKNLTAKIVQDTKILVGHHPTENCVNYPEDEGSPLLKRRAQGGLSPIRHSLARTRGTATRKRSNLSASQSAHLAWAPAARAAHWTPTPTR